MQVVKRNGNLEQFCGDKIKSAINKAFKACNYIVDDSVIEDIYNDIHIYDNIHIEDIQDQIEELLFDYDFPVVAKAFILYREKRNFIRYFVQTKENFINRYKYANNTADATIDDNSNVANKNIAVLNNELYKEDNIEINRSRVINKLKEIHPEFDAYQYIRDLHNHILYKNDENSTFGFPYCTSVTMYPFLLNGIRDLGGLSAAPKNIDSFCGMFVNFIFAVASQFAGAVATSEFLLCFDYFARKEWGEDYYLKYDYSLNCELGRPKTIKKQIHQYFQQVVYSINQPSAARGFQSVFWNISYFDKDFFDGMFGNFCFPDGTQPNWDSLFWLQREFMQWFNTERTKCMITFPVESYAVIYKDGKFADEASADLIAEMYSQGHSFFTYISDTADSLASCCFDKNTKVLWKSSTNGVNLTTLEELHNTKWEFKNNLRIFHNGSWVLGKSVKLPNRSMYKITTFNNKEYYMTDNHINLTLRGEVNTTDLTLADYLMFNTRALNAVPENNEHLTFSQGFVIGAFLGDGSFSSEIKGTIYETVISQNIYKVDITVKRFKSALNQLGLDSNIRVDKPYNNVYNIRISSKELVAFIQKWTNWTKGTYAYNKRLNLDCLLQSTDFRRGILAGWYATDGGNSNRCYTTSKELAEHMEVLITSLGMQSIIDISDRTDEKVIIRELEYNRNYPLYCVRWYEEANHRINKDANHSWIKHNNSVYFKIKSIEKVEYNDDVYCIECKNQKEPYFTLPSGLITHNCRLKNKVQTREFNFTNGNIGVQTGSKSVITLNLNRIVQDWYRMMNSHNKDWNKQKAVDSWADLSEYLINILERVYKYHEAYNELLWDMYDANLLPVYKAGFIDLNKQYLTIGLNGLTASAEFLGLECSNNLEYQKYCQLIFSTIRDCNAAHKTKKLNFNCELIPAESAGVKLYNWDKEDGYWVPTDINLYTSYIFKPYDSNVSILDKFVLHGSNYIGEYLDGGVANHVNLSEHPDKQQCKLLLQHAANVGCQYFTFNVPNSECEECGYITKHIIKECPKCGSSKIALWDRIIGYLSKIKNWSLPRQLERLKRIYSKSNL